jgi:hypothetical protein
MDHNGKPLKVTGILLAQRVAELPELIERLAARMMDNDRAGLSRARTGPRFAFAVADQDAAAPGLRP